MAETGDSPLDIDDSTVEVVVDPFGRALAPEWAREAEPEDLAFLLEAVCFALNRSITLSEAAEILGVSAALASRTADVLAASLRERGVMLQRHQSELQLVTRPQASWAVQRALNPEKPSRLSKAALETLAIVAYRQPITRGVLEAIRGVNCDAVLESMERRGLITEVGRQNAPGQPRLFGTTLRFLQIVGLERIEDLPPLPEGMSIPDVQSPTWDSARSVVEADTDAEPVIRDDQERQSHASADEAHDLHQMQPAGAAGDEGL